MKLTARNLKEDNLTRHTQIFFFSLFLNFLSEFLEFWFEWFVYRKFHKFLIFQKCSKFYRKNSYSKFFFTICVVLSYLQPQFVYYFSKHFKGAAVFSSPPPYPPHPENLQLQTLSCDVTWATSQFQDGADTGWKRSIERTRCSCDKRLYFTAKIK